MCLNGALRSISFNLICIMITCIKNGLTVLTTRQETRVCVRTEHVLEWCSMLHSL